MWHRHLAQTTDAIAASKRSWTSVAQVENRVSNWNAQTPLGQRFVGIAAEAHVERDVVLRHRVEEVHNGHVRVSARFGCARDLHRFVAVRLFSYFDIQDELIYMDRGATRSPTARRWRRRTLRSTWSGGRGCSPASRGRSSPSTARARSRPINGSVLYREHAFLLFNHLQQLHIGSKLHRVFLDVRRNEV